MGYAGSDTATLAEPASVAVEVERVTDGTWECLYCSEWDLRVNVDVITVLMETQGVASSDAVITTLARRDPHS